MNTAAGGAGGSGPAMPLAVKLGVEEGMTVALLDAPKGWSVPGLALGTRVVRRRGAGAEVAILFVRRAAELERAVALVPSLRPADTLWVAWPRRAGGHASDVTDEVVRAALLPTGLVDVKVAALDHDWSGLRFVWRRERR